MSANGSQPSSHRRNHGRGHSYYIDGVKVPSVTGILGDGYPKAALINWAAETTAGYAVDNWDELGELSPSARIKQLERARWDVQKEAALRGTVVHEYADRLAGGEDVTPPDEYVGHVDAYLEFVREWEPTELYVEAPVFSRRWRYAGTPDVIARLADERTWLLDWKTAAKGVFLDNVLQLAALRFAEYTVDAAGAEVPLPTIDAAGIVWLRADGYDLIPVEATERAFRTFLAVKLVAGYVTGDRDNWVGNALMPPELEPAHD